MSDLRPTNSIHEEVKNYIFHNYGEKSISDSQMAMALKLCQEFDLSPLKREIHFLPFRNSQLKRNDLQPVVAYTEYIKKAQATGKLDGYKYDIEWTEDKKPDSCTVTIHRKDWEHPFIHTVRFNEVVQKTKEGHPNNNWKNKPSFMIMKVGISQAMRLAFPEEVGALPYEDSEARNLLQGKPQFTQDNFDKLALLVADGKYPTMEQVKSKYELDEEQEEKVQALLLPPIDESEPIDLVKEIEHKSFEDKTDGEVVVEH